MIINLFMKPVINNNTIWEETDGEVVLIIKNTGFINRVFQKIIKKPKISYIHLDKIGSYVWKKIDGINSIYDIGIFMEREFDDSVLPIYERLTSFLNTLKENDLILFKKK